MPDFKLGWPEFLVVGFVALLLFGSRLPNVMRHVGQRVQELEATIRGEKRRHPRNPFEAEQHPEGFQREILLIAVGIILVSVLFVYLVRNYGVL
jgi:Sec-independent protein translocase protein TatA